MHLCPSWSASTYVLERGQIRYSATMTRLAANDEVRRAYHDV